MARARALRKRLTEPERILWSCLRRRGCGALKFSRQIALGPYAIADFYCHEVGLVVEVDGPVHEAADPHARDRARDAWLESRGMTVLRFTNDQVQQELTRVLREIRQTAYRLRGRRGDASQPPERAG